MAAGGAISTANDLATWIEALVTGRELNAKYQHLWFDSLQPEDPSKPNGQKYGYGIAGFSWGPNSTYFHGGETAGYNSFMGHDPNNHVTLVVWTNLTDSLDGRPTANTLMLKVLDQIYVQSPLASPGQRASLMSDPPRFATILATRSRQWRTSITIPSVTANFDYPPDFYIFN